MEEEIIKFKKTILYTNFFNKKVELEKELFKIFQKIEKYNNLVHENDNLILKLKKQQQSKIFIIKNKILKFLTFGCVNFNKKIKQKIKTKEKNSIEVKTKLNRLKFYHFQIKKELNNLKDIIEDQKLKIETLKTQVNLYNNNKPSTSSTEGNSPKM